MFTDIFSKIFLLEAVDVFFSTDDIPEGSRNKFVRTGSGEILVTGEVGPVMLTTNDETDFLYS